MFEVSCLPTAGPPDEGHGLILLGGHEALVGGLAHGVDVRRQILHPAFLKMNDYIDDFIGLDNTNLKHVSDLLRVDVEVLARVDGDDGRASKGLNEVIDIALSQSV